ncbi:MAG: hypothetical protein J2O49_10950 [Sciscionella sp.]|nr:hypothetical protein [Sciscionella sp.]
MTHDANSKAQTGCRPDPTAGKRVSFGGLKDKISYSDKDFEDIDPDIQEMFYGRQDDDDRP